MKHLLQFASLGKGSKPVSESSRHIGLSLVLCFSMLPKSQSQMSFQLNKDKSDLLDTKWHTGVAPYFQNASLAFKLIKFFESCLIDFISNRGKEGYVSLISVKRL